MDVIVENPDNVGNAEGEAAYRGRFWVFWKNGQGFSCRNRVFEDERYCLIKRWDEDQKKLGHKLFI